MRTHYDNLHVSEKAGAEVIRAAYKALAQKWHPDKHVDDRAKAERYFKIISSAYEVLSDPDNRREYDEQLAETRSVIRPEAEPNRRSAPAGQAGAADSALRAQMAEAWEDGKRSRQQGHSESSCPYKEPALAKAWREGHQAAMVISDQGSAGVWKAVGIIALALLGLWLVALTFGQKTQRFAPAAPVPAPAASYTPAKETEAVAVLSLDGWAKPRAHITRVGADTVSTESGMTFHSRAEFRTIEDLQLLETAVRMQGATAESREICGRVRDSVMKLVPSDWTTTVTASAGGIERMGCAIQFSFAGQTALSLLFTELAGSNAFQLTLKQAPKSISRQVLPISAVAPSIVNHAPAQPLPTPRQAPQTNRYPNCVFKAVMTDVEYAACGLGPAGR